MGECGCAATQPFLMFPGPEGVTYILEIYNGCSDCNTPLGVIIHRINRNAPTGVDAGEAVIEGVPEARFRSYDDEWPISELAIPIVDPHDLHRLMGGDEVSLVRALIQAACDTQERWQPA